MRTTKELESLEFRDDLSELDKLLTEKGITHKYRKHPAAISEAKVKDLLGYFPTGEYQIHVGDYSVIRGMCSFGDYEIMNIKDGEKFKEPEQFSTAEELVEALTH